MIQGSERKHGRLGILGAMLAILLAISMGCAAEKPAPAPSPVATSVTSVAPTPGPTAIPTPVPATPTPTPATLKIQRGGTFRFARTLDVKSLDPGSLTGVATRDIAEQMFDKLVDVDMQFNIIPRLARSWDISSDGKEITFRLVKGAKFHDGTDFNAQAVKFHFERMMDPKVSSRFRLDIERPVEKVEVKDDYTVTFRMRAANRPFLAILTDFLGFIESPTAVQKTNSYYDPFTGKFGLNPVGTGPLRFKEWVPDNRITTVRFDGYWEGGLPYFDTFTYIHVPEVGVQFAMVRTGEADIIYNVRASDVAIARRNPNLRVFELEGGKFHTLQFHHKMEPFSSKALRQAIAYSTDRQALVNSFFQGAGKPGYSPITMGWASNLDIKTYEYNPQKAKEKLAEAGYPGGIAIPYWCSGSTDGILLCELHQAMLKAVGMGTNVLVIPPAESVWARVLKEEVHFYNSWWYQRADPGATLERFFHSKGGTNPGKYSNPEVDRLIERAAGLYDTAEVKKLYDQVQRIAVEDVAFVFTVWDIFFVVTSKKVQNFQLTPDLYPRLKEVWLLQ